MINARERFRAKGDLWPCPNPIHEFKIGKLIGQWQIAKDVWSEVTEGTETSDGKLVNYGLMIATVNTIDDRRYYKVVIWKFCLLLAFTN